MVTFKACPSDRMSTGNISLGTTQNSVPHDAPKPALCRHVSTSTATAYGRAIAASPLVPSLAPMIQAVATFNQSIINRSIEHKASNLIR